MAPRNCRASFSHWDAFVPSSPRALHHTLLPQRRDVRLVVSEAFQYLVGVLAGLGRVAELLRLRIAAQVYRLADDFLRTVNRMIDRRCNPEMLHLAVRENLVDGIDRAARHAGLVEHLEPVAARALPDDLRHARIERAAILRAQHGRRVIGVAQELPRTGRI